VLKKKRDQPAAIATGKCGITAVEKLHELRGEKSVSPFSITVRERKGGKKRSSVS